MMCGLKLSGSKKFSRNPLRNKLKTYLTKSLRWFELKTLNQEQVKETRQSARGATVGQNTVVVLTM